MPTVSHLLAEFRRNIRDVRHSTRAFGLAITDASVTNAIAEVTNHHLIVTVSGGTTGSIDFDLSNPRFDTIGKLYQVASRVPGYRATMDEDSDLDHASIDLEQFGPLDVTSTGVDLNHRLFSDSELKESCGTPLLDIIRALCSTRFRRRSTRLSFHWHRQMCVVPRHTMRASVGASTRTSAPSSRWRSLLSVNTRKTQVALPARLPHRRKQTRTSSTRVTSCSGSSFDGACVPGSCLRFPRRFLRTRRSFRSRTNMIARTITSSLGGKGIRTLTSIAMSYGWIIGPMLCELVKVLLFLRAPRSRTTICLTSRSCRTKTASGTRPAERRPHG